MLEYPQTGKTSGKMYTQSAQMEPLWPARTEALEDLARQVVAASAELAGHLAPATREGLARLLRVINSYYSNLIEGHNTHPIDIERAMRREYSDAPDKRDLQIESHIHIEVQEALQRRLADEPTLNVVAPEFLCWLHEKFYERLPESLRWGRGDGETRAWVEAGQIRQRMVQVGWHLPPHQDSLPQFLERWAGFYAPERFHGVQPLLAAAVAHHRLMWIHPFLDGNGRVARLFTDAYLLRCGVTGYGLWNVSRGLARRRDDYRRYLAEADAERANDWDGRGNLSDRGLTAFCAFFLEACFDQARYLGESLALPTLLERLEKYVRLRADGLAAGLDHQNAPLRPTVGRILQAAAVQGYVTRGEVFRLIGKSERTGRDTLKALLAEGLLVAETERGAVRLGFPAHAAGYWLPGLYPIGERVS